jgi:hypothetical protein
MVCSGIAHTQRERREHVTNKQWAAPHGVHDETEGGMSSSSRSGIPEAMLAGGQEGHKGLVQNRSGYWTLEQQLT